jgi:mono/diheme cytochrome c family protein
VKPDRLNLGLCTTALVGAALLTAGVAGCHKGPGPKPLDQLTAGQQHGHQVFAAQCSMCHYDREDTARKGPALIGLFRKQYLPSGRTASDDNVTSTIQHGRGMMPAQPFLQGDDLNDLLAYLHSL